MEPPPLAHSFVTAPDAAPERWMLFLHGILGSGDNWRGIARRLVAARPGLGAVLVDLRMHDSSLGRTPPHTLAACADDLMTLERVVPGPVSAVLGHSFGGKVALTYLARRAGAVASGVIVDSNPGLREDARGSESTLRVLRILQRMPERLSSREGFVERVESEGETRSVGQWLAKNLERRDGSFAFKLDLDAIRALLDDYFATDLWPIVEAPPAGTRIELVVGGRSAVFDDADRARAARIAAGSHGRVGLSIVPEAGHWVHVDAPDELLALTLRAIDEAPR